MKKYIRKIVAILSMLYGVAYVFHFGFSYVKQQCFGKGVLFFHEYSFEDYWPNLMIAMLFTVSSVFELLGKSIAKELFVISFISVIGETVVSICGFGPTFGPLWWELSHIIMGVIGLIVTMLVWKTQK